ncbi:hypothetical protein [Natronobacterium gregoryi]|uniref:Uncharacterized protein n=2 Tax=Natronobacterium gregoryi TaxID=44930 RepID=L0AL30_NATGS|nr:hypothetical protein [Natronobacterium gregoryi]AFZ73755.1 hypothetical protein Natgr_2603 [Natronobacterium gregoryi SP2]ELY65812.1 hypothetical protein C490_13571 [Natronobacterium gregoryi SP2]PLK19442.1 hypothetical protein CYV19_14855 [Natronobacterium gregoryi SP2]SFJ48449.1 hypothetical protein SAMN05443661_13332 [Natronobacterium gregoryi]
MVDIKLSEVDNIDKLRDNYQNLDVSEEQPFEAWAQQKLHAEIERVGVREPVETWAMKTLRRDIREEEMMESLASLADRVH